MNELTKKYLNFDHTTVDTSTIRVIFDELIAVLSHHNCQYYELASPEISDGEYDILFSLLKQLEEEYPEQKNLNSPTLKIGTASLADGFTKAEHPIPLISLSNSYNTQDLLDRDKQLKRIAEKEGLDQWSYNVDPKLDGSSVEIVYRKGHYLQAITRGDGTIGEDITNNVSKLRNIPLYIKAFSELDEVRLRGEIVLPINSFEAINKELIKSGDAVFANPRNAAAGTLRQRDSQIVYERGLVIFIYDVLSGLLFDKQTDQMQYLIDSGIPVHAWKKYGVSLDQVVEICKDTKVISQLESDNIEMDGLVIKVNDMKAREIFGSTEHHPRRAMAFKFPTKQVAARIHSVTYQVGRTGAITPVAELEPIALGGVTISRATLHNFDNTQSLDIRIGDRVRVQRSGEVIPYILGPILSRREGVERPIGIPEICPVCSTPTLQNDTEVAIVCPSLNCEGKIVQQMQHLVAKNCLNIQGLGASIIELLVQQRYLNNPADLFGLSSKGIELKTLQGIGDKKIGKILEEIEGTKTKELWRRIHGFGIKFVGKKVSQDLSKGFSSWRAEKGNNKDAHRTDLLTFFSDDNYLTELYGLGKQTIESVGAWSNSQQTIALIEALDEEEVKVVLDNMSIRGGSLSGKKFVITGSFEQYSRDQLSDFVIHEGGALSSSVSKNTDYLLCGEKAGSKLTKAKEAGVTILKLSEFFELTGKTIQTKKPTVQQTGLFG